MKIYKIVGWCMIISCFLISGLYLSAVILTRLWIALIVPVVCIPLGIHGIVEMKKIGQIK